MGSEMCIRDRVCKRLRFNGVYSNGTTTTEFTTCRARDGPARQNLAVMRFLPKAARTDASSLVFIVILALVLAPRAGPSSASSRANGAAAARRRRHPRPCPYAGWSDSHGRRRCDATGAQQARPPWGTRRQDFRPNLFTRLVRIRLTFGNAAGESGSSHRARKESAAPARVGAFLQLSHFLDGSSRPSQRRSPVAHRSGQTPGRLPCSAC